MPRYATVVFDCDSTLSTIEGIEELASAHRAEVVALTEAAMRGAVPLEEVYGRRLALIRPTREQVDSLGNRYIETLVPDTREVIAALQGEGVEVRIVSGGLLPAIRVLARALGVAESAVAAVDLHFDERGDYAGFDAGSPLAYSGGKRVILERWADELPRPVLMVGDGVTDLEARPVTDGFIAFAGVVEREPVVAMADAVVSAFSLAPLLPLALGGEMPQDPAAHKIFLRGVEMLENAERNPEL